MSDEWKSCIDPKRLGGFILKDAPGAFTKKGYLIKSGDLWHDDYYNKDDIPKNYRISPQEVFKQAEKEKSSVMDQLGKTKEQAGKVQSPVKKPDLER